MNYRITDIMRESLPDVYSFVFRATIVGKSGVYAHVARTDGVSLHFSRLDGKREWRLDARFTATGAPVFVHGFGSLLSTDVATGELAALLDRAAPMADLEPFAKAAAIDGFNESLS